MPPLQPLDPLKDGIAHLEKQSYSLRTSDTSIVGGIANELVKSYGFRREPETGDWSWSLDNIGQAFKEDPIWTSIDYLSLMAGPLKFGLVASQIERGALAAGAVGKAYKALKTGEGAVEGIEAATKAFRSGEKAGTLWGKVAQKTGMLSDELITATEMKLAGPSRLHGFRIPGTQRFTKDGEAAVFGFANPITTKVTEEYSQLVEHFGAEVWENRAIVKSRDRELLIQQSLVAREAENISRQWQRSGLDERSKRVAVRLLARGAEPAGKGATRFFENNPAAASAYKNTWAFRNSIHEGAFETKMISEETYTKNLNKYVPRLYEEWQRIRESMGILAPRVSKIPGERVNEIDRGVIAAVKDAKASLKAAKTPEEIERAKEALRIAKEALPSTQMIKDGAARMATKGAQNTELTRIWDPNMMLGELAKAGQVIARQRYAQGLAKSVLARDATEVFDTVHDILKSGDSARALMHGVSSAKLKAARTLTENLTAVNRKETAEEMAELLGWRKIESLYDPKNMPTYIANLPEEFKGKWLDPHTAEDIMGTMDFLGKNEKWYGRFYKEALTTFRASKTAYNPSTHIRNIVGAAIFGHLATGGLPHFMPLKGLKEMKAGGSRYTAFAKAGGFGSAVDFELHQSMSEAANLAGKTALDWMPHNAVTGWVKKAAGGMERFYRGVDEVYKLDAFIRLSEKFEKKLGKIGELTGQELTDKAHALAIGEVNKFMPNFMMHSELSDVLRKGVPFASFTSEAMRVWKSTLMEKPHLAYFYNHVAQTMSETFGAMAGFSPEQIAEAQNALPSHMKGKKTLMLPFNIDGQPQFLDLSYMIPMGNLVEAQDSERLFFTEVVDPTTNPLVNLAAASATGKDPFSGRDIAPNFTERQLGIAVDGKQSRKLVGLAEHTLQMFLPPLAPPGYAGVNILEYLRGQKNPKTGGDLENGAVSTLLANVAGLRAYAPNVEAQVKNVQEEERRIGERLSQSWDRWEFARANGDVNSMESERQRILTLKRMEGADDPEGYFSGSIKSRKLFNNLSTKQLEDILGRADKLGALSPRDEQVRAELVARYQGRHKKPFTSLKKINK